MTNWIIYRCDRIKFGCAPQNEQPVEDGFRTAMKAMDRANELQRADSQHSYTVGGTEA